MEIQRNRYPGAQPFTDDPLSHRVFFGREEAAQRLADEVLANGLVVVYGRSGLGKTSLLNAGLAPLLRDEGYLPLFVRVNDTNEGALGAVLAAIPAEAARQGVEYEPGLTASLWSFFKTAEFWQGDRLMTPVLILDQFEELFTIHTEQERVRLLDELSYLTRSVRPPSAVSPAHDDLSERPPAVRIVLSLREDYLGFLEEGADQIPQIFDTRFRLSPLDRIAAENAIVCPARVDAPEFDTRPFTIERETITGLLDFLSRHRTGAPPSAKRHVDPFQLQLVCRRIEQIVAARQRDSASEITITMADIGGEPALTETLRHFYDGAVRSLPERKIRRATRRLCEEYLISPEGRRLSLEELEIRRQVGLTPEALRQLVSARLLRTDHRSNATYYELSHDALVEPVLASQHNKVVFGGWLGVVGGSVISLFFSVLVLAVLVTYPYEAETISGRIGELFLLVLLLSGFAVIAAGGAYLFRSSAHALLRLRLAREGVGLEKAPVRPRVIRGIASSTAGAAVAGLSLIILFFTVAAALFPSLAEALDLQEHARDVQEHGLGVDYIAAAVGAVAGMVVGAQLIWYGIVRMIGFPIPWPSRPRINRATVTGIPIIAGLKISCAVVFFLATFFLALSVLVILDCSRVASGPFNSWIPPQWFRMTIIDCGPETFWGDLFITLLLIVSSAVLAISWLIHGSGALRYETGIAQKTPDSP